MHFDFEKPIQELIDQLEKAKETHSKGKVAMDDTIKTLEAKIEQTKKDIYGHLSGWQKVQISRHPERPYALDYIYGMAPDFMELHGDRNVKDDNTVILVCPIQRAIEKLCA